MHIVSLSSEGNFDGNKYSLISVMLSYLEFRVYTLLQMNFWKVYGDSCFEL